MKKEKSMKADTDSCRSFGELLRQYFGDKVAIIAARYQYRGTVAEIGEDFIVLADAAAVESSGQAQGERPTQEDPIGSSVCIKFDAIEIVFQPNWVNAPMRSDSAE